MADSILDGGGVDSIMSSRRYLLEHCGDISARRSSGRVLKSECINPFARDDSKQMHAHGTATTDSIRAHDAKHQGSKLVAPDFSLILGPDFFSFGDVQCLS